MSAGNALNPHEFQGVRQEILESQKIRNEFLKYKLFTVAAIASVGLGLSGAKGSPVINVEYLLCLIPLVCLYIDIICYHNNCRIRAIARFLEHTGDRYENYLVKLDKTTKWLNKDRKDLELHEKRIVAGFLKTLTGRANNFSYVREKIRTDGTSTEKRELTKEDTKTLKGVGYYYAFETFALVWMSIGMSSLLVVYAAAVYRNTPLKMYMFFFFGLFGIVSTFYAYRVYDKKIGMLRTATDDLKKIHESASKTTSSEAVCPACQRNCV